MKVYIYKLPDGRQDIMVEASVGTGLSPVVLRDVQHEDIREKVGRLVHDMRRRLPQAPQGPE